MTKSVKYNYRFLLVLIMIVWGCESKKETLSECSKDNNLCIELIGEKLIPFDPFNVTVNVRGYGFDEKIEMEIYSEILDSSNVSFDWLNMNKGHINIIQQDGSKVKVYFLVEDKHIKLQKVEVP